MRSWLEPIPKKSLTIRLSMFGGALTSLELRINLISGIVFLLRSWEDWHRKTDTPGWVVAEGESDAEIY
jgi:hypothetical protein